MTDPKISIILPTYNREQFIGKAISSVLAQSFCDWELIVWNDGSKDDTKRIIKSFNDERIKYFSDENHGKCYALNQAIQRAEGEYIAFLDDDDQWLPDKLNIQDHVLCRYAEIDVLFSNYNNLNLANGSRGSGFFQTLKGLEKLNIKTLEEGVFLIQDGFAEGITTSNFILPSTLILKAEVIRKVGEFNEELRNSLDFEYWWRVFLNGYSFAYIEKILVDRIKPEGSLSSPGVTTYKNAIKCLDFCNNIAHELNRDELIPLLEKPYRNNWLGILRESAIKGKREQAFSAFFNSLRYGISARAMYLLLGALLGPRVVAIIKRK